MSGPELVLAGAACSGLLALAWGRRSAPLTAANHRGETLPVVLGLLVVLAAELAVSIVAFERAARSSRTVVTSRVVWVTVAFALVFTAGLLDDLAHGGPRGLRGHLRALRERQLSTGLAKVAAAIVGAVVVVGVVPGHIPAARALGVVLIAGSANLWNGLDVAPGRAAKAFLLAGAGVLVVGPAWAVAGPVLAMYGAALPAAWLDLREKAMLGDAGANVFGFGVGAGLYTLLPWWGTAVAAAAVVGLNVLAETITLSRAIAAVPPLRWFDSLGRPKKSVIND
ncbi:MAG: hypothetical protein ABR600_13565 [Actinomycetota bacterium]